MEDYGSGYMIRQPSSLTLSLLYPQSMTYLIPSTVNDVSAMLVDTIHLRVPAWALSKIFAWRSAGSWEYMGRSSRGGTLSSWAIRSAST